MVLNILLCSTLRLVGKKRTRKKRRHGGSQRTDKPQLDHPSRKTPFHHTLPIHLSVKWWKEERIEGLKGVKGWAKQTSSRPSQSQNTITSHITRTSVCWSVGEKEERPDYFVCHIFSFSENIYWLLILQHLLSYSKSTQHNFIKVMRSFSTCNYNRCKLNGQMPS